MSDVRGDTPQPPNTGPCPKCDGTGRDVIRASNGGVGEVVRCWPCAGTGRRGGVFQQYVKGRAECPLADPCKDVRICTCGVDRRPKEADA